MEDGASDDASNSGNSGGWAPADGVPRAEGGKKLQGPTSDETSSTGPERTGSEEAIADDTWHIHIHRHKHEHTYTHHHFYNVAWDEPSEKPQEVSLLRFSVVAPSPFSGAVCRVCRYIFCVSRGCVCLHQDAIAMSARRSLFNGRSCATVCRDRISLPTQHIRPPTADAGGAPRIIVHSGQHPEFG